MLKHRWLDFRKLNKNTTCHFNWRGYIHKIKTLMTAFRKFAFSLFFFLTLSLFIFGVGTMSVNWKNGYVTRISWTVGPKRLWSRSFRPLNFCKWKRKPMMMLKPSAPCAMLWPLPRYCSLLRRLTIAAVTEEVREGRPGRCSPLCTDFLLWQEDT